jgi:tetratricopeptide (TPR) repeat protein
LPQWKELAQRISFSMGFGGDVSDVTASSPEKTDEAFHLSYKYTRKDFGDWPNHRILAPEPLIALPGPKEEELLPLGPTWLGPSIDVEFRSQVELPNGYKPMLPAAIHLKWDFAQYDATYDFKDGKVISERHLQTLLREVPSTEREHYKELAKTIQDDYGVFIPLISGSGSLAARDQTSSGMSTVDSLRNLPESGNAEALRLENAAREAVARNDVPTAVSSLYRAVAADPQFTRAWLFLGSLLLAQKQDDAGIDAFHRAMAVDPKLPAIPKTLGYGLMAADRIEQAIPVWQDFIKKYPDDSDGPSNLGNCYLRLMKYPEAAEQFEAAAKMRPDLPNLQMSLGSAYLQAGEREKAAAAFILVAKMDSDGNYLNDVAYNLADANLSLPLALEYAKKAVRKAEEESQKITLQELRKRTSGRSSHWRPIGTL